MKDPAKKLGKILVFWQKCELLQTLLPPLAIHFTDKICYTPGPPPASNNCYKLCSTPPPLAIIVTRSATPLPLLAIIVTNSATPLRPPPTSNGPADRGCNLRCAV